MLIAFLLTLMVWVLYYATAFIVEFLGPDFSYPYGIFLIIMPSLWNPAIFWLISSFIPVIGSYIVSFLFDFIIYFMLLSMIIAFYRKIKKPQVDKNK